MERQVGNRRTDDELQKLKIEQNRLTFKLDEQKHFIGTPEQLELMQNLERAYIDGAPMVSDEEWDILKSKHSYEESISCTAPSGRKWVKLLSPLPSLDKAGNLDEFASFLGKFDQNQMFQVEIKLDGLTANVRYRLNNEGNCYEFDEITSRGNGRYGLALHPYALAGVKTNIPMTVDIKYAKKILKLDDEDALPQYFELRGEAVVPKNDETYRIYGENSVWRSVASGMFTRKVPFNLPGVYQYLFDGRDLGDDMLNTDSYDEIWGRYIKLTGSDARLVASLTDDDPNKFMRNDYVAICESNNEDKWIVRIVHKNANEVFCFEPNDEWLDVVFYSASIDGSNIDDLNISLIPGLKHISDVKFMDKEYEKLKNVPLTYMVTSNRESIMKAVFDFYGTDENGKRDLSKPRLRNLYEYAADGVVIKPVGSNRYTQGMYFRNAKNNPNKIISQKYPDDQIAVKLLSEIVRVKLVKIEKTETDLKNVTCSGILDKTYLTESGAYVNRVNLHNPEWLEQNNWIKEGEEYDMIMSMDVIPVLLNPNI